MRTPKIKLRDEIEIQYAHDTLHALITGELPKLTIEPETQRRLHIACDVLCWVLKHDHNQAFAENLESIRKQIHEAGYRLQTLPDLMPGSAQGGPVN